PRRVGSRVSGGGDPLDFHRCSDGICAPTSKEGQVMRIAAFVLVAGLALAPAAQAGTFSVTNLGDGGPGSLRQAILDANAAPGADTITFSSSASGTIALASTLPTINDAAGLTIAGPGA